MISLLFMYANLKITTMANRLQTSQCD